MDTMTTPNTAPTAAPRPGRPVSHRAAWTAADDAVLLDRALSHPGAARFVGRSVRAVASRRIILARRLSLPAPVRAHATGITDAAAARDEAGRQCRDCGVPLAKLAENRGHNCRRCTSCITDAANRRRIVATKADDDLRTHLRKAQRNCHVAANRRTMEAATNRRKPYTADEIATLLRPELSHAEAAAVLGRTPFGVARRRFKLKQEGAVPAPIRAHASPPAKYVVASSAAETGRTN